MIDRTPEDSGEKMNAEMLEMTVRVEVLEIRVGAVATGVKTLREQINGDDDKR